MMALTPRDDIHLAQINAGTIGRKKGHEFEKNLTQIINSLNVKELNQFRLGSGHILRGNPAIILATYIKNHENIKELKSMEALWMGGLATSGEGDALVDTEGHKITKSKCDVLMKITTQKEVIWRGISVKTCNNTKPTNPQLYFSTASAFSQLLRNNGIPVSQDAEKALKMFCGDQGHRPLDHKIDLKKRKSDPNRYFFEELPSSGRKEWIEIFTKYQDQISLILLKKAYSKDPYAPDYLLQQTVCYSDINNCEVAVYSIAEFVELSKETAGFWLKPYMVRKGSYKGDPNMHEAPRFGVIQFQRGGQKQHPTQLQFNLKAGYFKDLAKLSVSE